MRGKSAKADPSSKGPNRLSQSVQSSRIAVPARGAAILHLAILVVGHPVQNRPVAMGQAVIGPLVLGQAIAVHLGQKAEVIRQREIPDRQSDRQLKALPPGVERQCAPVRSGGNIMRHVQLDMKTLAEGLGRGLGRLGFARSADCTSGLGLGGHSQWYDGVRQRTGRGRHQMIASNRDLDLADGLTAEFQRRPQVPVTARLPSLNQDLERHELVAGSVQGDPSLGGIPKMVGAPSNRQVVVE